MSAIAGVTNSSLTAYSYFRAVFDNSGDSDPSSPANSSNAAGSPSAGLAAGTAGGSLFGPALSGQEGAQGAEGGHHHHHHGGGHGVIDQIEQAVTNALESAQDDSSADPNKLIEEALAQLFEKAGAAVNGDANSGGDAANPAVGLSPDESAAQPTSHGWGGQAADNGAFVDALQSAGIDPAQFRADFLAAIKDAQAGQANAATALQSVPPGTRLDVIA